MKQYIPNDSSSRKLNVGLREALRAKTNYPDDSMVVDLIRIMDILGDIPLTGALRPKVTPAIMGVNATRLSTYRNNIKIAPSLARTIKSDTSIKGCEISHGEVKKDGARPWGW